VQCHSAPACTIPAARYRRLGTLGRVPDDELDHTIDDNDHRLKGTIRVNPKEIVEIAVAATGFAQPSLSASAVLTCFEHRFHLMPGWPDLLLGFHLARYTYRGRPGRAWPKRVTNTLRPALQA
jgi:hypothetical protein